MSPRPGDAITDVIANAVAGRTTYMLAPIQLALADIREGRLRAPGVTDEEALILAARGPDDRGGWCFWLRLSYLVWSMRA